MATQHFKRNLLLNLYREEKISLVCFLLPHNRDKNVWHLQPISSVWRPLAFLPVTLSGELSSQRGRWILCCRLAGVETKTSWHQSFLFFHGTSLLHGEVNGGVWVECTSTQCFHIMSWTMLSDVVAGTVRLLPTILKPFYLWAKEVTAQHNCSLFKTLVKELSVPKKDAAKREQELLREKQNEEEQKMEAQERSFKEHLARLQDG